MMIKIKTELENIFFGFESSKDIDRVGHVRRARETRFGVKNKNN